MPFGVYKELDAKTQGLCLDLIKAFDRIPAEVGGQEGQR